MNERARFQMYRIEGMRCEYCRKTRGRRVVNIVVPRWSYTSAAEPFAVDQLALCEQCLHKALKEAAK